MINPRRLSLARRRRGLTKKRLGDLIGVTSRSITAYESGEVEPSENSLQRLADALRFPADFLCQEEDLPEPSPDNVSFRALSRMTASQRDAAIAGSALALHLFRLIERLFSIPEVSVPDLRELDPLAAADAVRAEWGLGQRPVSNMIHLLESRGIVVFSLSDDCAEVDAFSLWEAGRPFVILNTRKSAERSRFDSAHELGHLVLHRQAVSSRRAEEEANAFASAFLMPEASVLAGSMKNPTLRTILEDKRKWGVSAMAYARRLHDVGLQSEWIYRQLCRQMASLGYRSQEPNSQPREGSRLLWKVRNHLRAEGVSQSQIARELNLEVDELDSLVAGLVPTGMQGGGAPGGSGPKPVLSVVTSEGGPA